MPALSGVIIKTLLVAPRGGCGWDGTQPQKVVDSFDFQRIKTVIQPEQCL
jgi:hypothetical protein